MAKTAIIVLAGTESHADLGRVSNALTAAKEFADAGAILLQDERHRRCHCNLTRDNFVLIMCDKLGYYCHRDKICGWA